ncbi:MAG: hypothetical protein JO287_08605 [Pseudonocardiales bacterium]|nr:hypothetical protein [Pseudonocardiales bacterium]
MPTLDIIYHCDERQIDKLGLSQISEIMRVTPVAARLGEFCLDCALDQDGQEAADRGVGEVLYRALELVAHVGLVVVSVMGVLDHQLVANGV